jgi:hypothetical protein
MRPSLRGVHDPQFVRGHLAIPRACGCLLLPEHVLHRHSCILPPGPLARKEPVLCEQLFELQLLLAFQCIRRAPAAARVQLNMHVVVELDVSGNVLVPCLLCAWFGQP